MDVLCGFWDQPFNQMGVQASCGWPPFSKENCFIFHILPYKMFIWAGPIAHFGRQHYITYFRLSCSRADMTWPELINGLAMPPCFSNRSTISMLSSISLALLSLGSVISWSQSLSKPCTMITGMPLRWRNARHEASFSNCKRANLLIKRKLWQFQTTIYKVIEWYSEILLLQSPLSHKNLAIWTSWPY